MSSKEDRKEARECFMQLLFEMEMHRDYSSVMKEQFLSQLEPLRDYNYTESSGTESRKALKPAQAAYFNKMFDIINSRLEEIDNVLENSIANWKMERIARVDLAILRLSAAEILYFDDIPNSVSINEAVELAKKFGSEDSGKFINGILGRIVRGKDAKDE